MIADNASYLYNDSTAALTARLDVRLVNAPMLGVYNGHGGVQLAPDTSDPFDTSNFPSARYPYAFETFGNNGTTPRNRSATDIANHSLDDLINTTPNAATVYADIKLTGSGDTSTGSDHYPVVGDYNVVPTSAALIELGFGGNGYFQIQLTGAVGTTYGIEASTDLVNWSSLGLAQTDANGVLVFQDMNAAAFRRRFYRAYFP